MRKFGNELKGSTFKTKSGITFKVLGIDPYPEPKVSKRYEEILKFKPGSLVAVPYRGILIPNISLKGGVARLTSIEIGGKTYNTPKAISAAIGIEKDMYSYNIKKIG